MDNHDRALTIKEVAKFLNISTQMVYNLVKDGSLKAFKIGTASRIMYSDLLEYIQQQKEKFARNHGDGGVQPDDSVFKVSQVSVQKGGFRVNDVSFSFPKGKSMALLGPSGSGKTLLLRAIAGLEPLENGAIFLGKSQLDTLAVQERRIGFVFENYALFPNLNARGNIEFPLNLQKKTKNVLQLETKKRLNELHINASYLPHLPDELPEGMKQLVAIAREKNHEVDLFLMDEPMSKLDAAQHLQMRVFIRKIIGDLGKTTLISSNDPEDALVLSDYLGVIVEGRLLQFGETWEVYNYPTNLAVMEMTSRLGLNTIRVEVKNRLTQPYNVLVEKEDGMYNMAFRTEEIKLASEGIPAKISFSRFFDGKRKLGFCEVGESKDVKLMLPIDVEDEISFLPLNPQFFPVGEE